MSKEIKFRAFNKKLAKMIYNIQEAYDTLGWEEAEVDIGYPCRCFGEFLEDDRFEVMQYTGLKDKNGDDVYEGDILDCGDRKIQVIWHEGCGLWDSEFIAYYGDLTSNGINTVDWKYRASIIGNIYENPEHVALHN